MMFHVLGGGGFIGLTNIGVKEVATTKGACVIKLSWRERRKKSSVCDVEVSKLFCGNR